MATGARWGFVKFTILSAVFHDCVVAQAGGPSFSDIADESKASLRGSSSVNISVFDAPGLRRNLQTTCCADSSTGYSQCTDRPECATESKCTSGRCKMKWLLVPVIRDGCCSKDGLPCDSIDPTTDAECQYLSEDCIDCGGTWISDAPPSPTSQPTKSPTNLPTAPLPTSSPTTANPTTPPTPNPTASPNVTPATEAKYICHKNSHNYDQICSSGSPIFDGGICQSQDDSCGGAKTCWVADCTAPTSSPTPAPTPSPTANPTDSPIPAPSKSPTASPSKNPTASPTSGPSKNPTKSPTQAPSKSPTKSPSSSPTSGPSPSPTSSPVKNPTSAPSSSPTTGKPTSSPVKSPTSSPSKSPTAAPTSGPSPSPTSAPVKNPTSAPSSSPTTGKPTSSPVKSPTSSPTKSPTPAPSTPPTISPTGSPTKNPTPVPSSSPTTQPTTSPNSLVTVTEGVFPLGLCEGDCDIDADCAGTLRCFVRGALEAVPGCVGEGISGDDYCAEYLQDNFWLAGNNGIPAEAFPLGFCEGDCDNDSECAPGLHCMSRSGDEIVPGCSGDALPGEDYCFVLPENFLHQMGNDGLPEGVFPLQKCFGDCDNDGECAAGLVCQQRSGNEPVPGCDGPGTSGIDYCTFPSLVTVGDNGTPEGVFPLGMCEGDCDVDADCAGTLRCFVRGALEAVPGCVGEGISGDDYCAEYLHDNFWPAGNNGIPAEAFPLGHCEGDCDNDSECAPGLHCMSRSGDEIVPGCSGDALSGEDYCFILPENFLHQAGNNGLPEGVFPLQKCFGDCDNDSECAAGLVCQQRSGNEPVAGCDGPGTSGTDYCMDPMTPTSSPTPLPTSAPVLPTPNPTPAPPTPTSSPTSAPSCPPFLDTDSPTGPPNTITYKPGENTATSNEGYLRISTGLLAEIIAESGSPVELKGLGAGFFSSDSFHSLPDGATVIEKDCGGGWYYVSNSESGSSSSFSGGVGAIEFDSQGQVVGYRRILNNTRRNCGGGRTWWGTWITCEEVSNGLVYEVHPENTDPNLKRQTLIGATAGNYESVAYDKRPTALHPQDGRPRFFLTEDSSNGPLERFRPSQAVWNAAQQSGDYSDLLHVNDDGTAVTDYLFITPQSSGAMVGTFVWTSSIASGKSNAQSYYPNCEGIDIRDGMLYMTCKARKQLFILDLDAQTYVESSTATGAFSGQPDQIASLVGTGDNAGENIVYFCEDVGDAAGVHARDSTGEYYTIVQDEGGILSKETTGLAFSPDRKYMYVSYQMGYIYKIWRDDGRKFGGTSLDIKYHSDVSGPIFSL